MCFFFSLFLPRTFICSFLSSLNALGLQTRVYGILRFFRFVFFFVLFVWGDREGLMLRGLSEIGAYFFIFLFFGSLLLGLTSKW